MNRFIAFAEFDPFGRRPGRFLRGAGAKSRPTYTVCQNIRSSETLGRRVNRVTAVGATFLSFFILSIPASFVSRRRWTPRGSGSGSRLGISGTLDSSLLGNHAFGFRFGPFTGERRLPSLPSFLSRHSCEDKYYNIIPLHSMSFSLQRNNDSGTFCYKIHDIFKSVKEGSYRY